MPRAASRRCLPTAARSGSYPSLELLVQALDCVGGVRTAPLARRQTGEGQQPFAGLLQAVGEGAVLEPPFAQEGLARSGDLVAGHRVDHIVVVGGDLVMQAFRRMRQQAPVLVDRAALHAARLSPTKGTHGRLAGLDAASHCKGTAPRHGDCVSREGQRYIPDDC
jgi:hypothetical protein